MENSKLYKIGEVAELLGVHEDTIRKWEEDGLVAPDRIGRRRDRRYTAKHIYSIKEKGLVSNFSSRFSRYKDYSDYSKEQLIKEMQLLKKQKKYGLVWEDKTEDVVEQCKKELPVLKEDKGKEIKDDTGKPTNILIEGDNYHSLAILNYTHKGKIDVIYIDPPYNTGKDKEWRYNDKFIDSNDQFRHSKWLSMMDKRLRLAKNLLSEKGVIFISIDDNEQANLKLLCDKVFGEENFVTQIIWQSKTGASDAKTIDTTTEYILVYIQSPVGKSIFARNKDSFKRERYRFEDEYVKQRGPYYPDNLDRGGLRYSDKLNYPITCPDGQKTFPNGRVKFFNDGWTWKWGQEKVKWGIESGYIEFKKAKNKESGWSVYYKNYLYADNQGNLIERSAPKKNLITDIKTGEGSLALRNIFGGYAFQYPKPVRLIKTIVEYVNVDDDMIVLDFMAGSGTTGHAVLELNKEDGGNRQFILCTNNENNNGDKNGGIAESVCYPRIKKAMEGYDFKGIDRTDLYEREIKTPKDLKKYSSEYEGEIESIKEENEDRFDDVKTEFRDYKLKVVGENKINDKKEGLGGNLKYFKVDFVSSDITDINKRKIVKKAIDMLCVKENAFDNFYSDNHFKIFKNDKDYLGVVFDEIYIDDFKTKIQNIDGKIKVYIFSFFGDSFDEEFEDMKDRVVVHSIPNPILETYNQIFKL